MAPRSQSKSHEFHIVVLGAGGVGKSCLTAQFVHNEWIESYDPTIEDSYRTLKNVDGRQVMLEILDTAGTEQFVAMRDLYMKAGEGFLLVFSITSKSSLAELVQLREEIIRIKDDETVPIVICGNKLDLDEQREVPRTKVWGMSQAWNAPYYEASARTRTNVDEVFEDLSRQLLKRKIAQEGMQDADDYVYYEGESSWRPKRSKHKHRRGGDHHHHHHRCVIL